MTVDRTGQLANSLVDYLNRVDVNASGVDTSLLADIINEFLPTEEQLQSQAEQDITNLGTFKRFTKQDIVQGKVEVVTQGLWTGGSGSLTTFFSSSDQDAAASGKYYLNVYQTGSALANAEVQFAVTYGHRTGGGWSGLGEDNDSTLPTKGIYSQYRNMLLDPTDAHFTFLTASDATGHDSDDIYVINVNRARFREKMDPGNIQITLSGTLGTFTFIDNSGKKISDDSGRAGRVFSMVSGSLNPGQPSSSEYGNYDESSQQGYGLFYPDVGIVVLNPTAISGTVGPEWAPTTTTASDSYNHRLLYRALESGSSFTARRTENISTAHYFVRLRNKEFNFSNNPTFVTGSAGSLLHSSFKGDPKTYPTTIGLYNDANEMLAVAKLSQPLPKSFDKEALIKVKLDF